jgi:hypothetical protein
MKHIFLVHSPITYLVAVSVIKEKQIEKENAIIIFDEFKKFISNENYISISLKEFYTQERSLKKVYNYFKYFNIVNRVDRVINHFINNNKFIAYIPVLHLVSKSLITHSNCYAYNFIEEGLVNYYKEETLQSFAAINSKDSWRSAGLKNVKKVFNEMYMVLRGYNFKLQSLPFSYSNYGSFRDVLFYGLSEESFPLVSSTKKIILSFRRENYSFINNEIDIDLSNSIVWIGDGGVFHHGFSEDVYLQGILQGCISFIKEKCIKKIFIKFHRDEPSSLRNKVQNLFTINGILFQVIPDSVIMELLLFKALNVTLIGVYSSLLYYASIMGHKSFSIYEYLKQEYEKVLKNRDFSFYWEKVNQVKLKTENSVNGKA